VLENGLVRLAVLRRRRAPCRRTVGGRLLGADVGEVPLYVAIRTTVGQLGDYAPSALVVTDLPRGVVKPMPLYMVRARLELVAGRQVTRVTDMSRSH
jgi:hypothetical protein